MKIIHMENPITQTTICHQPLPGTIAAKEIGQGIRQLEYNRENVLCAGCWHSVIGAIRFDTELSYSEELKHLLPDDSQEIVDAEIIEGE